MLHIGLPAEESGHHDLAGGGWGVEADGTQHGALAIEKKGMVFSATKWSK
jgi:hypothetical protein